MIGHQVTARQGLRSSRAAGKSQRQTRDEAREGGLQGLAAFAFSTPALHDLEPRSPQPTARSPQPTQQDLRNDVASLRSFRVIVSNLWHGFPLPALQFLDLSGLSD